MKALLIFLLVVSGLFVLQFFCFRDICWLFPWKLLFFSVFKNFVYSVFKILIWSKSCHFFFRVSKFLFFFRRLLKLYIFWYYFYYLKLYNLILFYYKFLFYVEIVLLSFFLMYSFPSEMVLTLRSHMLHLFLERLVHFPYISVLSHVSITYFEFISFILL